MKTKYNDSNLKTEEKAEVNMLITSLKTLDASNIGINSWYDFCMEIQRKCVHMRKYAYNKKFIA